MPWRICLGGEVLVGWVVGGAGAGGAAPGAVALRERIPDWAKFAEQVEQLFGADGVAEVLDKERSGGVLVECSV